MARGAATKDEIVALPADNPWPGRTHRALLLARASLAVGAVAASRSWRAGRASGFNAQPLDDKIQFADLRRKLAERRSQFSVLKL